MGHYKNECPLWEKTANYAEMEEDILLMAQINEEVERVWYLDSGCSNHMCGVKEWFVTFDDQFRQQVRLGDDRRMQVEGRGNLRLEINGTTQVISSVYFIPGLKITYSVLGSFNRRG